MRSRRLLLAAGCALAASVLAAVLTGLAVASADGSGRVSVERAELPWVLDGGVDALAVADGKLFVGGAFEQVAAPTGPLVAFTHAGKRDQSFPAAGLDTQVAVAVGDGEGGLYVGGNFDTLGGVACRALVHIRRGGGVDRGFCPRPDGVVYALARSGSRLYVGGSFKRIAGVARASLAALDVRSGEATAFSSADRLTEVWQLAASTSAVYVLGEDSPCCAVSFIAADPVSGETLPFAPDPDSDPHGASVTGFALAGDRVYAWGYFGHIGGQPRNMIAAVDAKTGQALDWQPKIAALVNTGIVADGVLYLGGWFDRVNGGPRAGLAAFAADTGRLLRWKAARGVPKVVWTLGVGGGTVYVAGSASDYSGSRQVVARSVRNGAAVRFSAPRFNGAISTLAVTTDRVVVGGRFRSLAGSRHVGLLAVDAPSGRTLPWQAGLNATSSVKELAVAGSTVYVAGFFGRAGGRRRVDFAAFDAGSGALLPWDPPLRWYLGGLAANSRGVYTATGFIADLGKLDPRSGAIQQRLGTPVPIGVLAASDDLVFDAAWEGENVRVVALATDPLRVAAVFEFTVRANLVSQALAAAGRTVYVGGSYTRFGPVQQRYLARLRLQNGALRVDSWRPRLPGPVHALSVTGANVVVAGTLSESRWYVALVDTASGKARVFGYGRSGGPPEAVAAIGRNVYVGGSFGLRRFRS